MSRGIRTILWTGAGIVIALAAIQTEAAAGRRPQGNIIALAQTSTSGFYGEETGRPPSSSGGGLRTYRWTQAESGFAIWPALDTTGLLKMEYLNPAEAGDVELQIDPDVSVSVRPARLLRTMHLLLPRNAHSISLTQTKPVTAANRQLGMLIASADWGALAPITAQSRASVYGSALRGLPLTLGLLAIAALVLGLRPGYSAGVVVAALAGTALLALSRPWESRALQPALQWLLWSALAGAALFHISRRLRLRLHSWAALLFAIWGLTTVLFLSPLIRDDGVGYYAYLRSTLIDHDLHFDDEFNPGTSPLLDRPIVTGLTATGYVANPWSVGPAIAWSPFWLVAHVITKVGQAAGTGWQATGYDPPYRVLIGLASALASFATMLGCFVLARRWVSPMFAVLVAVTIYLGSNLLYYAQFEGSYAHSLSAATTTWFIVVVLLLDDEPTLRHWIMLGLAAGVMMATYWVSGLLLLVPFFVGLRHAITFVRRQDWKRLRRLIAGAVLATALTALVFTPQMLAWKIIYGSWLTVPQGEAVLGLRHSQIVKMLFGPLYGLVWWTPAYFAGLAGSVWLALRRPWPGLVFLGAIVLYLFYNSILKDWHGSGAFGLRRITALTPLFAVGLAAIVDRLRRHPVAAFVLAAALAGWSLYMTARYAAYVLPHAPTVLQDLRLSEVLLSPPIEPFRSLWLLVRSSWFAKLTRAPHLGDVLILLSCLVVIAGPALLIRRARRWLPVLEVSRLEEAHE